MSGNAGNRRPNRGANANASSFKHVYEDKGAAPTYTYGFGNVGPTTTTANAGMNTAGPATTGPGAADTGAAPTYTYGFGNVGPTTTTANAVEPVNRGIGVNLNASGNPLVLDPKLLRNNPTTLPLGTLSPIDPTKAPINAHYNKKNPPSPATKGGRRKHRKSSRKSSRKVSRKHCKTAKRSHRKRKGTRRH